ALVAVDRIDVFQLAARELLMPAQVEVRAVVNALELLPAERELVLDVVGPLGIVSERVRAVLLETQLLRTDPERPDPFHSLRFPELEPLVVGARLDEELHLHLLELARTEDEVSRRDLVAERLADLRDP